MPAMPRVEARSASLLAVGVVNGDRMSIHLSRLADNSPVQDAQITVTLRGMPHATVAEADGSYAFEAQELKFPGTASLSFRVRTGAADEQLQGLLVAAEGAAKPADRNSARQLWWWVLNFAVCIGFLWLWSRRRKP